MQQLVGKNAAVAGGDAEPAPQQGLRPALAQLAPDGAKAHGLPVERSVPLRAGSVDEACAPDIDQRMPRAGNPLAQPLRRAAVERELIQSAADGAQLPGEVRAALHLIAKHIPHDHGVELVAHISDIHIIELQLFHGFPPCAL